MSPVGTGLRADYWGGGWWWWVVEILKFTERYKQWLLGHF